jgi:hypothetical protein
MDLYPGVPGASEEVRGEISIKEFSQARERIMS